jgi:hypothetical protein
VEVPVVFGNTIIISVNPVLIDGERATSTTYTRTLLLLIFVWISGLMSVNNVRRVHDSVHKIDQFTVLEVYPSRRFMRSLVEQMSLVCDRCVI